MRRGGDLPEKEEPDEASPVSALGNHQKNSLSSEHEDKQKKKARSTRRGGRGESTEDNGRGVRKTRDLRGEERSIGKEVQKQGPRIC